MKSYIPTFFLSLFLGATLAHGATVVINPGQSIQSAIDASSAGDIIYVNDGIYTENITLDNKDIRIIGQGANRPRIYNLIVQNYTNFDNIAHLSVTESASQTFTIENVQEANLNGIKISSGNLILKNSKLSMQNSQFGRDVIANQSTLSLRTSSISGNLDANQSEIYLKDSNVTNSVNAWESTLRMVGSKVTQHVRVYDSQNHLGSPTNCVVLQSTIGEKLTTKAAKSFICYNTIRYGYFEGKVDITGNTFDGRSKALVGIDLNASHTNAVIRNNLITLMTEHSPSDLTEKGIGIRIDGGSKAQITNNIITQCGDSWDRGTNSNCGIGVWVKQDTGTTIMGNFFKDIYDRGSSNIGGNVMVQAPSSVNLTYNNLWGSNKTAGGVINIGGVGSDPKMNSDYTLQPGSPNLDTGPPDARFNDRDGSRNDIGMFGGHNFIPNGKTTNKPIVLGLDLAPVFVPIGGITTIESTGATVK
jgi:hypothetical protein